jgi:hypothetical protein
MLLALWSGFLDEAYWVTGPAPIEVLAPNGNRRQEYQPTYHELKELRDIERKFEEARLDLKSNQIKIEELEFKRLQDLADKSMQLELLQLLAQQQELVQLIEQLQQQKLRAMNDDSDFIFLMGLLN